MLYDGDCGFCTASVERLRRVAGTRAIEYVSFRDAGALDRFPGVTPEACERAMQFVRADGRVFDGAEAFAQLLGTRSLGRVAFAYYLPGVRQIADLAYRGVAANRFRIAGRRGCDGACGLHDGHVSDK